MFNLVKGQDVYINYVFSMFVRCMIEQEIIMNCMSIVKNYNL